ncbi:hypothetical protein CFAM422_010774 [Trichoderma lentiforme]|uniref:Uncharacterized protein n=1 Tax=Trichoderma lentiforme TaxID=1567552 RepID=A0A9P4X720_9HYPO|nr:hypothetical protein CFAM422_010774 [Trichoderma lentiforme]
MCDFCRRCEKVSEVAKEQAQRKREAFWWMMYVRTGTEGCGARHDADRTSLRVVAVAQAHDQNKRLCSGSQGQGIKSRVVCKPTDSIS